MPAAWLEQCASWQGSSGQPLCPRCLGGYLHPYQVQINMRNGGVPYAGVSYLHGWVAVCVGNSLANAAKRDLYARAAAEAAANGDPGGVDYLAPDELVDVDPCGFSMPMSAEP